MMNAPRGQIVNRSALLKEVETDTTDFVADLQADLAAIGETGEEQIEDKRESAGSTAEVRRLIQEGKDLLKVLTTAVPNKFRDQPTILAEWQTASHVRRRNRKGDDKKAPADPAPPAK